MYLYIIAFVDPLTVAVERNAFSPSIVYPRNILTYTPDNVQQHSGYYLITLYIVFAVNIMFVTL
jgi:hypothetical protein